MTAIRTIIMAVVLGLSVSASAGKPSAKKLKKLQRTSYTAPQKALMRMASLKQQAIDLGQWQLALMADMSMCDTWASVSGDSLAPQLERMKQTELLASQHDPVVASLYDIYLSLYADDPLPYYSFALSRQAVLARAKAKDYQDLINLSPFTDYYGDDMLSVVLHTVNDRDLLWKHYQETSNRVALMMMDLEDAGAKTDGSRTSLPTKYPHLSSRIPPLDSLFTVYGDLKEAIEIDIKQNELMERRHAPDSLRYEFLLQALERWEGNPRANVLKQKLWQLSHSQTTLLIPGRLYMTSDSILLKYSTRNVSDVSIEVYRCPQDNSKEISFYPDLSRKNARRLYRPSILHKRKIRSEHHRLSIHHPATFNDTVLKTAPLPLGTYVVKTKAKGISAAGYTYIHVSNLRPLAIALPDSLLRIAVVDAETGQPRTGATLTKAHENTSGSSKEEASDTPKTLRLDAQGETLIPLTDGLLDIYSDYYIQDGDDRYLPRCDTYLEEFEVEDPAETWPVQANIYTDRSIYRPGQDLHVAAIAFKMEREEKKNEGGKKSEYGSLPEKKGRAMQDKAPSATLSPLSSSITISLKYGSKEILSEEVSTDDFGTGHTTFALPKDLLPGLYTVSATPKDMVGSKDIRRYGSTAKATIRIEEYKLPTFEVALSQPEGDFIAGDSVKVHGKAMTLTGQPVANAMVNAKIRMPETTQASDFNTSTDADGGFDIPLLLPQKQGWMRMCNIDVAVTDGAGESQTSRCSVKIRDKRYETTLDVANLQRADMMTPFIVKARNNGGKSVALPFTYWLKGHENDIHTATTGQDITLPLPDGFTTGTIDLTVACEGDTLHEKVIVFDVQASRPCTYVENWTYQTATSFSEGEPVTVQVGSSERNVHILYAIVSGENLLEQGTFDISDSIVSRRFDYQDCYRDGITMTCIWMKNGKVQQANFRINPPDPDYKLQLHWQTFRDKLVPGQAEEWRIRILNSNGMPANSQLMATIFDKSLDLLQRHEWTFRKEDTFILPDIGWSFIEEGYGRLAIRKRALPPSFGQTTSPFPSTLRMNRKHSFASSTVTGVANGTVKGKITDASGEPLIGVSITTIGENGLGAISDIDGNYHIKVSPGTTLVYSYIGYQTYFRKVTGSQINVRLAEDQTPLDEVVVTGYGKQKKLSVTGALKGTVKGVKTMKTGAPQLRVRGVSSLNKDNFFIRGAGVQDNILTIIDGEVCEASAIDLINADDILTFDVLEGSEAMAIYGARATGGAVVITTKTGESMRERLQLPVRENFQETAFFAPNLTTDSLGNVDLRFTLPENITTWRIIGLAHDREMRHGTIDNTAVARKDFMVQPQLPRFLREGDRADLQARIFNTAGKPIDGEATLFLLEPETELTVYSQKRPFHVEKDSTGVVTFSDIKITALPDPAKLSALVCKVTATANGMSDGEQRYLPVISRQELVTKTKAFTLAAGEHEHSIALDSLLSTTGKTRLTAEFTGRPSMLMLQAIYEYATPVDECALCQASAFFSLSIAQEIVRRHPDLVDSLKINGVEDSPLSRNEDLKNLLLAETPWLSEASREDEQRKQLADFLDSEGLSRRVSKTLEQLKKLQQDDGGWSWMEGMPSSAFITTEVATLLLRTQGLCSSIDGNTDGMTDHAFDYLKKEKMDETPSYQYLCALDGRPTSKKTVRKMVRLAKDTDHATLYSLARTAVTIAVERRKDAEEIVEGLKEFTVFDPEKGRYFDAPRAAYSWFDYRIPTQVAVIEALQAVTPNDTKTIGEMMQWLLQEKRTQYWQTTINSTNAIYAFMSASELTRKPGQDPAVDAGKAAGSRQACFTVDGLEMAVSQQLPATEYLKASADVDPKARELTLERSSDGYAWGAIYSQYMEQDPGQMTSSSGALSVRREVIPAEPGPLGTGKRVKVRIIVTANRDLDFVQIADKRPACLEPVEKKSGYRRGAYVAERDSKTTYFVDKMAKGTHVYESEYFIDRTGVYRFGTLTAQCAYAPEFIATAPAVELSVK